MREAWKFFETLWEARNNDHHKMNKQRDKTQSIKMLRMHKKAHESHNEARHLTTEDKNKLFEKDMSEGVQKRPKNLRIVDNARMQSDATSIRRK